MVPASEWKQELNEMKQSTQDTSNPKYMQANALFNLCNQNFLKSPRTRVFFKKKKIKMCKEVLVTMKPWKPS